MADVQTMHLNRIAELLRKVAALEADLKAERGTGPVMGIEVFRTGPRPGSQVATLITRVSLDLLEASRKSPTYLDETMATMRAEIEREMEARGLTGSSG